MDRHVIAPAIKAAEDEAADEMTKLIAEAKQGLTEQFWFAPADVRPLILVAIHNLEGLRNTKTSQETLVKSLKTIQEMTGMKNEQRMLLGFAQAMFKPKALEVIDVPALAVGDGDAT